jgi:hypothetical protein
MEIAQPEGIGGNKLRCNTTPIATTNNSDFGSVYNIINTIQNIVLRHSFSSLNFKCWSHEITTEKRMNFAMNGTVEKRI